MTRTEVRTKPTIELRGGTFDGEIYGSSHRVPQKYFSVRVDSDISFHECIDVSNEKSTEECTDILIIDPYPTWVRYERSHIELPTGHWIYTPSEDDSA